MVFMKDEKIIKDIASERIERLFSLAERMTEAGGRDEGQLAKRYICLARKISRHYRVKLSEEIKKKICKGCNSVLVPGINCTVRLSGGGALIYKCSCGEKKITFLNNAGLSHS